jgi:flagellar hook protein FlgE
VSLYSALYAGVSGLSAQASAMATVADNITNVNTIGYKGVSADFKTLVGGGRSGGGSYAAGGVVSTPKAMISKQGLLQAGSSLTDIGIDGNGFFVVRTSADVGSEIAYTRAGSFTTDKQGFLRNTAGYYLQGWPLDAQGQYVNTGNLDQLEPIKPNALTGSAAPTTQIQARINLSSTTADFVSTPAYAAGAMAAGTATPQFSRSMDIYDAQGSAHRITMGFVKSGPNAWQAEIYAQPATDVTGVTNGLLASGTVQFNGDGSLDLTGSTPALFQDLNINWANGANSAPIKLSLGDDGGLNGLTSFDDVSGMLSSNIDGGTLGTVSSVEISDAGVVTAVFEDGSSKAIYQLPIATVQNPDGLTRIAGNAYQISQDSGTVAINEPNSLGAGAISAGMLEASNADLATEFTNMIRFQRAYSASSKIITTVDDMLQEVSNLKR